MPPDPPPRPRARRGAVLPSARPPRHGSVPGPGRGVAARASRRAGAGSRRRSPEAAPHCHPPTLHPRAPSLDTRTAGATSGQSPVPSVCARVLGASHFLVRGASGPRAPPLSCRTCPETSSWMIFFPRRKGVELPGRRGNSSSDKNCHRLSLQNPGSRSFRLCGSCDRDSEAGPLRHPMRLVPHLGVAGSFQV